MQINYIEVLDINILDILALRIKTFKPKPLLHAGNVLTCFGVDAFIAAVEILQLPVRIAVYVAHNKRDFGCRRLRINLILIHDNESHRRWAHKFNGIRGARLAAFGRRPVQRPDYLWFGETAPPLAPIGIHPWIYDRRKWTMDWWYDILQIFVEIGEYVCFQHIPIYICISACVLYLHCSEKWN